MEEITQTLDLLRFCGKYPNCCKINMESSNYMVFRRIGGHWFKFIRVLGFSPRVLWYEFQTTNTIVIELFLD